MHVADDTGIEEMGAAWDEFVQALRRARARAAAKLDDGRLSLSQYLLVAPLLDDDALPTGELAARAAVSAPSATRMIDGLERDGLVARAPSAEDRRVVLVSLTPTGRTAADRKRRFLAERRMEVARSLSPAERVEAARILRRMAELVGEL